MGFAGTAVVYLLIGLAIGVALYLREGRALVFALSIPFWPLLAPFALANRAAPPGPAPSGDKRITAVQTEVMRALAQLGGLAEATLAPEVARVRGLTSALDGMSRRIAEMDELLASPQMATRAGDESITALRAQGVAEDDARLQSVRARLRNIERLRALRDRTRADLDRILLKLEEMASQLHVLRFAGRPEAELLTVIKEIADGIESISDGMLAAAAPLDKE
jgi:hypothetical protein